MEWNPNAVAGISMLLITVATASVKAAELVAGHAAPAFTLNDQNNKTHRLADYQGHWVVLYFYPKDDTPGCTTEACNFRDDLPTLRALGVQILGMSDDDESSHSKFAEKHSLPFPLLADRGGAVAKEYGSLWSFGPFKLTKRHTFIIDPQGKVARVYRSVRPAEHSKEVIDAVKELQQKKN